MKDNLRYAFLATAILCFSTIFSQTTTYKDGVDKCMILRKIAKKKTIETLSPTCMIGATFPDINLRTIEGKIIDSSYFKNKTTIVNLWFEFCPPCIDEIPIFNELVKKYGNDKINYLALGRDSEKEAKKFLMKHEWHFDHVVDCEKLLSEAGDVFNIWGYPTTFVIDKNGIIIEAFTGGSEVLINSKLLPILDVRK